MAPNGRRRTRRESRGDDRSQSLQKALQGESGAVGTDVFHPGGHDGGGQLTFGMPETEVPMPDFVCRGGATGAAEGGVVLPEILSPPGVVSAASCQQPAIPSTVWSTPSLGSTREEAHSVQLPPEAASLPWTLSVLSPAPLPDSDWPGLEPDLDASETRRATRNAGVHSGARTVAATAGLPSNQTRRLALEHTYIQGEENRLCGLLEDLRKVRAVEASPKLRHPSLQLLDKAKELNRIRFQHGDDHDRLTMAIQSAQPSRITDVSNPEWGILQFSPITVQAAAAEFRRQVVGAPPAQMWMPTIGRTVEIGKILEVCASYRGPPCTITSPDVNPPGCKMLSDHFERLNTSRMDLMRQMSNAQASGRVELEAHLASLHNEHSVLMALVICANSRLIGTWRHKWQPPYQLGPQMLPIWESLKLTPEQRWQLFSMREQARDIIVTAKSAHTCSFDLAADLARSSPDASEYSTLDNVALLDMVEAAEQAKFTVPAAEYMVALATSSNILSPLQSARLIISTRVLLMSRPGLQYEVVDIIRFLAACLLDEELGAWLDDTPPPPGWSNQAEHWQTTAHQG